MAFAFAFQSLPPNILEKYFGRLHGISYSGLGLNVIGRPYQVDYRFNSSPALNYVTIDLKHI
ncbi:hypothetical protein BDV38DRAFT_19370 [Aspergillus pseudotamarii]|uniref:Uncharacterized protein n=1 Tax=Aspergillus pseudotamarii TaxID=132259 RepID=A0A5N6T2Q4_ASPPS|nr:uncharacterized protein BDV38DRAFT_19370 [Aspergillus pseudotamarii]KAE8140584.1 hypothetical protein BDV38DRAFT_19370 [Aspergillus pseudotamarii]